MKSKSYEVWDNGARLASNMTLSTAFLFMRAYVEEYYNESVDLRLIEMEKVSCGNDGE